MYSGEEIAEKTLWIRLSSIEGIGSQTFCQLLKEFGSPANVFSATFKQLTAIVSEKIALSIKQDFNEDSLKTSQNWLMQANNHLVTLADAQYPHPVSYTHLGAVWLGEHHHYFVPSRY